MGVLIKSYPLECYSDTDKMLLVLVVDVILGRRVEGELVIGVCVVEGLDDGLAQGGELLDAALVGDWQAGTVVDVGDVDVDLRLSFLDLPASCGGHGDDRILRLGIERAATLLVEGATDGALVRLAASTSASAAVGRHAEENLQRVVYVLFDFRCAFPCHRPISPGTRAADG